MNTQHESIPIALQIGSRIALSGHLGTVKFIGPVDGTSGVWLGIEWDDPARGKHNGIKDGRRYFECSMPGSASFIRPSASIITGQSFLNALRSKYMEDARDLTSKEFVVLGSSNGTIEVEAVGLDKFRIKLSQLYALRHASLETEYVATVEPADEISRACPNLSRLDISRNLLTSWESVASLTSGLQQLDCLLLNHCRLNFLADIESVSPSAFSIITELYLNDSLISWSDLVSLLSLVPNLTYLEAGYNRYRRLKEETSVSISKLEDLNLDGNLIEEWSNVLASVRILPKLKRLVLTANRISAIPFSDQQLCTQNISNLGLSSNGLDAWADIDALHSHMPELETLSIAENPLTERHQDFRPLIIARLPSLVLLNSVAISAKERVDSELYYMSQVVREEGQYDDVVLSKRHPQWMNLCKKYGKPDVPTIKSSKNTIEDRLILVKVNIIESPLPDNGSTHVAFRSSLLKPTEIRVLPTMTVRMLRLKLLKTLKISKRRIQMWRWLDGRYVPIELDNSSELNWVGIDNNSELIVHIE